MKKNPVMELMVCVEVKGLKVRVWWTDDGTLRLVIYRLILQTLLDSRRKSNKGLAKAIAKKSPSIAAVEVLDADGQGVVFYPDWK